MDTTTGRRLASTLTAAAALLAGTAALAPQASANSFFGTIPAGGYDYNDGTDQFCISAEVGRTITVTLTPADASRGPKRTITSLDRAIKCTSLATAYEDSRYTARISGTASTTRTIGFYS